MSICICEYQSSDMLPLLSSVEEGLGLLSVLTPEVYVFCRTALLPRFLHRVGRGVEMSDGHLWWHWVLIKIIIMCDPPPRQYNKNTNTSSSKIKDQCSYLERGDILCWKCCPEKGWHSCLLYIRIKFSWDKWLKLWGMEVNFSPSLFWKTAQYTECTGEILVKWIKIRSNKERTVLSIPATEFHTSRCPGSRGPHITLSFGMLYDSSVSCSLGARFCNEHLTVLASLHCCTRTETGLQGLRQAHCYTC